MYAIVMMVLELQAQTAPVTVQANVRRARPDSFYLTILVPKNNVPVLTEKVPPEPIVQQTGTENANPALTASTTETYQVIHVPRINASVQEEPVQQELTAPQITQKSVLLATPDFIY